MSTGPDLLIASLKEKVKYYQTENRELEKECIKLSDILYKIARYSEESIWWDDRDDAASEMLRLAQSCFPSEFPQS